MVTRYHSAGDYHRVSRLDVAEVPNANGGRQVGARLGIVGRCAERPEEDNVKTIDIAEEYSKFVAQVRVLQPRQGHIAHGLAPSNAHSGPEQENLTHRHHKSSILSIQILTH